MNQAGRNELITTLCKITESKHETKADRVMYYIALCDMNDAELTAEALKQTEPK